MARWEQHFVSSSFGVHRGPDAALIVQVQALWQAGTDERDLLAEYVGADVDAELSELHVRWQPRFHPTPPQLAAPNGQGTIRHSVALPWDAAFVRTVEEARARAPGDFTMKLRFSTHYRLLKRSGERVGEFESYAASGPLVHSGSDIRMVVSRDAWIRALGQMGWDGFEIFEVPVRRLAEHEPFKRGLALLREAQQRFRAGDWQSTLVKARHACEAAVAEHGGTVDQPETDLKVAFAKLGTSLFPADVDKPRRELIDSLFGTVNKLRHMGAHGTDPRFRVRREDAELSMSLAIQIFRYIGETYGLESRRG